MSLARPTAALRLAEGGGGLAGLNPLASQGLGLPESAGVAVTVELSVGRDHDRAEVHLAGMSRLATIEVGDQLAVELGYGDELAGVLTGEATAALTGPDAMRLEVTAATRHLVATRIDRSFTSMSVADIVADLLAAAGVDAGTLDAPITYAAYHVDARRTVWDHLHALADRTGSQITTQPDGTVSFAPAPGLAAGGDLGGALGAAAGAAASALGLGDVPSLRRGATVLGWEIGTRAVAPPVTIAPLGAASKAGPDKWGVPRGEPESHTGTTVVDPALRDQDSADTATAARAADASRASRGGTLTALGDAGLRPGQVVDWDDERWRVLRVRHRLSYTGFLTTVTLQGAA